MFGAKLPLECQKTSSDASPQKVDADEDRAPLFTLKKKLPGLCLARLIGINASRPCPPRIAQINREGDLCTCVLEMELTIKTDNANEAKSMLVIYRELGTNRNIQYHDYSYIHIK